MQRKLKRDKIKRRISLWENAILILIGASAFVLARNAHSRGIEKKWLTVFFGTLIPFSFVIYAFRQHLLRWSFWASLATCLAVHIVAVWTFVQYALADFQNLSIWFWFPIMLVEAFVLLIVVKRIEEKFTGQHEKMKLDF
jgi:hypothetical protein